MFYVYLLASAKHGTLYLGVTRELVRRIYEHKSTTKPGLVVGQFEIGRKSAHARGQHTRIMEF